MVPADESFHRDQSLSIERQLRLEEHDVLVALKRVADPAFERESLQHTGVGFLVLVAVERVAVPPVLLGAVHGAVGALE